MAGIGVELSMDPTRKRVRRERPGLRRLPASAGVLLAATAILAFVVAGCSTGSPSTTTTGAPITTAGASITTPTSTRAGGTTTTVSSTSTVPTSAGAIKTYEDATYHYAFDYPKDWQFTEDVSVTGSAGGSSVETVGVFDPKGDRTGDTLLNGLAISIYQLNTTVDESLMPAFKEELLSALPSLEGQLTDPVTVEPMRNTSINGVPGFETTYTFNNGSNTLRSRMLFLVQGDVEYQITVQAVDGSWQEELPKLNLVLNSFRSIP